MAALDFFLFLSSLIFVRYLRSLCSFTIQLEGPGFAEFPTSVAQNSAHACSVTLDCIFSLDSGFIDDNSALHVPFCDLSTLLQSNHSRFLVNQTKNSRSKTTTIPRFATLRQTRLDYAIEPRFSNRASILDHSRFLVNQTKNSRSKTTTIPRFATLRQTRLDYAIEPPFFNRASIFQSSLHFPIEPPFSNRASIFQSSLHFSIEPRFFNRGSFLHPRLVFKKERKKERNSAPSVAAHEEPRPKGPVSEKSVNVISLSTHNMIYDQC